MSEQDNPAGQTAGRGRGRDQQAHVHGRRGRRRSAPPRSAGPVPAGKITDDQARLIDKVTAASASGAASLSDVKHIVILMQENRQFDHYFGTLSGVRGLLRPERAKNANGTPSSTSTATSPASGSTAAGYTQPFNLLNNPPTENGYGHQRHRPQLGRPAQQLERRQDGLVHHLAPGDRRHRQRPGHHGLLHPQRAAVLPRAGRRVHDLRRLPLLGARPDRPEPADGVLGLDRPGRRGGRPGDHHRLRPARDDRQAELEDDARGAAEGRGELEGLQRPDRPSSASACCRTSRTTPTRSASPASS